MDRWYLSAPINQARATALNCAIYGPISPWQQNALTANNVALPAVLLANDITVYATVHDDGIITSGTIDTLGAPFVATETAQANLATTIAADLARLQGVPAVLRNQATIASGTTVTAGNVVNVTQTIVNDLAIFCARLADFIEGLGLG